MKAIPYLAAAVLGCCLCAAPALADVATPAPGTAAIDAAVYNAVSPLDLLTASAGDSETSILAASTPSTAAMAGYYTPIGADSTVLVAGAVRMSMANDAATPTAAALSIAEGTLAISPMALSGGSVAVGNGIVVSSADTVAPVTGMGNSSSPLLVLQPMAPAETPVPPSALLMGSALAAFAIPRRRFLRAAR